MKDPFIAQPELPGRTSQAEIIVARESDIKEAQGAGPNISRTRGPRDWTLYFNSHDD